MKVTPRSLYHGERHTIPTVQEAGLDTGPEWTSVGKIKNFGLNGIQTPNGPAGRVSMYPLRYPGSVHITLNLKDMEWNSAAWRGRSSESL